MLHNESVNVWSHLLGSIFIIVLFFYTALVIKKNYFDVDEMTNKFTSVKGELCQINTPHREMITNIDNYKDSFSFEDSKDYINDYMNIISNKTIGYFNLFDAKLNDYKQFIANKINCLDCLTEVYNSIKNFSEHFIEIDVADLKEKFINETSEMMKNLSIDRMKEFLNETNVHFVEWRDQIIENLESKEMEWIDGYTSTSDLKSKNVKKWPLFVFLIGAISCLSMSTVFHLFFVKSKELSEFLARFDYAGISLLIAGSCFPIYYYSYFCKEFFRIFYLSLISAVCLFIFLFSLTKTFTHPSKRKVRGVLFLVAGLSTAIPIVHLLFIGDDAGMIPNQKFGFWIIGGLSYVVGSLIYMGRFPEKKFPGKFCYYGSSHQIWHCLVITGIVMHYLGSIATYHERLNFSECT